METVFFFAFILMFRRSTYVWLQIVYKFIVIDALFGRGLKQVLIFVGTSWVESRQFVVIPLKTTTFGVSIKTRVLVTLFHQQITIKTSQTFSYPEAPKHHPLVATHKPETGQPDMVFLSVVLGPDRKREARFPGEKTSVLEKFSGCHPAVSAQQIQLMEMGISPFTPPKKLSLKH